MKQQQQKMNGSKRMVSSMDFVLSRYDIFLPEIYIERKFYIRFRWTRMIPIVPVCESNINVNFNGNVLALAKIKHFQSIPMGMRCLNATIFPRAFVNRCSIIIEDLDFRFISFRIESFRSLNHIDTLLLHRKITTLYAIESQ